MVQMAEKFSEALIEGYGQDFTTLVYDSPDFDMLANLERNVYHFSAAKNYQMLKELTLALKDGDRIRSFEEFRREAFKTLDTYIGAWMRTEYNTAVGSAQMAAKWVGFEADKDVVPNLEYSTAGDERVRDEHRALDGVIKPVGHSFWSIYYPPNGWNCRCTVIPAGYGQKPTHDAEIEHPDVPAMFRVNLAKKGLAFPSDHPYYDGVPEDVLKQGQGLAPDRKKRK